MKIIALKLFTFGNEIIYYLASNTIISKKKQSKRSKSLPYCRIAVCHTNTYSDKFIFVADHHKYKYWTQRIDFLLLQLCRLSYSLKAMKGQWKACFCTPVWLPVLYKHEKRQSVCFYKNECSCLMMITWEQRLWTREGYLAALFHQRLLFV